MPDLDPERWLPAADTLRAWALDEDLKQRVMSSPALASVARRVADRYTAGESITDAIRTAQSSMARGHDVSLEYAGESVRDAQVADEETEVFVELARAMGAEQLASTLSFDLSHVGSVIDPELGLANALRIAAAAESFDIPLMLSAEGSDRTDLVLSLYERLAEKFPRTGITVQARLHRTPEDLQRVLALPGRIRLVKGAFLETGDVAWPRDSPELTEAYLGLARKLVDSGHATSIATHDAGLLEQLMRQTDMFGDHVEVEMLLGLGTDLLDQLRRDGHRTREYVVFGEQWWLYVLNRIAEDPARVHDAIVAAAG